jgi:DNA-binding protein HU-beta
VVNKAELVAEVAERLNGADPDARQYVDAVFDVIMRRVAAGERVQILGFGTFDSVGRAARVGRNPRTGAAIQVPAGVSPRFHAGQTFRAQVTDGSALSAAPEVAAEVQEDVAKPAKAKKAKAADKKPAKAAAEKQVKAAEKKPAKAAAQKQVKAEEKKPAKTAEKTSAKPASKKAAKPAEKKPAKALKETKKSAKAGKAGKK